jgi:hypothetical protein
MITYASFMRPVAFRGVGLDFWTADESNRSCNGIRCHDKGTHLLFVTTLSGKEARIKVPLTNIAYVIERDDEKEAKK